MDWLWHIVTFIVGLGAGWQLKVVVSSRSNNSSQTSIVSQKGNQAGGDIVAGNKTQSTNK